MTAIKEFFVFSACVLAGVVAAIFMGAFWLINVVILLALKLIWPAIAAVALWMVGRVAGIW